MKTHFKSIFNIFTLFALLASLIISVVFVTPARAAMTLSVNSFLDAVDDRPGNGVCHTTKNTCTLRAAIQEANARTGADTIIVPAGTYTFRLLGINENAAATGDLDIKSDLTIYGAGADSTIIQAGAIGYPGVVNGIDRVFHVIGAFTVNISGVTIRNGNFNKGASTGGGIYNDNGILTVTNSTFSGNSAFGGGGIYNDNGTLTVTNSTFSSNSAFSGGGIYNSRDNLATSDHGTLAVTNSTFNDNSATGGIGGGIVNGRGTLTLTNSTLIGNSAVVIGGGIYNNSGGIATLRNTIIANSTMDNCVFTVSVTADNMADDATCGSATQKTFAEINLGTLTGSPAYFPLNKGSAAIDAGNNAICASTPVSNTSQNGVTRPADGNSDGTAICDIGSYEAPSITAPTVITFTATSPSLDLNIPITSFTASAGVTGYTITLASTPPALDAAGWTSTAPKTYLVTGNGVYTLYPWVKDAAGNISAVFGTPQTVIVNAQTTPSIFTDVPSTYWASSFIERLYNAGITSGCSTSPLMYCPLAPVTRVQMAIFILRSMYGKSYTPPAATGTVFSDVSISTFGAAWIEQFFKEGITTGCGNSKYCPDDNVTRAQMAIFLLKGKHGSTYIPPVATGIFSDVPVGSFAADWIEQLAKEAVTSGCGGGMYCPNTNVTRDQMAVFLVKAFNIP